MKSYNRIFIRFCIQQASYWSYVAAMMGYMTSYMLSKGISSAALGYILAANLLTTFLGSIFWGRRIDAEQNNRKYYIMTNIFALILGSCMFQNAGNMFRMMLLYPLYGFMVGHTATNLDSWVMLSFPEMKDAVGRTRFFATFFYAVTMLVCGQLISKIGYSVMPVCMVLFLGISITAALLQNNTTEKKPMQNKCSRRGIRLQDITELLWSRDYLLLVAAVFLTGLCIAPLNNMKPVILSSVGADVSYVGYDSFIGCMIQAPFLLFSGYFRRFSKRSRLLAGVLMPLLYALFTSTAMSANMVIAGGICNNISFGLLFPTMREMTEESVNPTLRNTAHSIVDVSYGSFSGMIALLYSSAVIDSAGFRVMGGICVIIQIAAILVVLFGMSSQRTEVLRTHQNMRL